MTQVTSRIGIQTYGSSDLLDQEWSRFGFRQRCPPRRIEVWIYANKLTLEKQRELVQVRPFQFLAKFLKRSDIRV